MDRIMRFGTLAISHAAALLLLLAVSPPSEAQVVSGSNYVSTGYGVVDGNFALSARLSSQIRNDLGVEFMTGFVPSRGSLSDIYTCLAFQYHLWPEKRLVPHISGGAGAATLIGLGDREVDFVSLAGVGVNAFVTQKLAFRFDVEDYFVFLEDENDARTGFSGSLLFIF